MKLLFLYLLVFLTPFHLLTANDGTYRATPILIASSSDLIALNTYLGSTDTVFFQLAEDITIDVAFNGGIVVSIPNGRIFVIDGDSHTLSAQVTGTNSQGIINVDASAYSLFSIASGASLAIQDLTIKGGKGTAILNNGSLVMENSQLTNSGSSSYPGGGLNNTSIALLKNTCITRNVADYGGGFLNRGTLILDGCIVSENRNIGGASRGGGGGENSGTIYANNTVISNNQSTEIGGGINNCGGNLYLINSSITGNISQTASSTAHYGGGIGMNGGTLKMANCILSNNYASNSTSTFTTSDLGIYNGNISDYVITACTYGTVCTDGGTIEPSGSNTKVTENTLFERYETSMLYDANGNVIQTLAGDIRPALIRKHPLLSSTSVASSNGVNTYFNYSDLNSIKMGYEGVSVVVPLTTVAPVAADKVSVTLDANHRSVQNRLSGAVGVGMDTYYMVKVTASAGGHVEGGTVFGDYYMAGEEVTLRTVLNAGYAFAGFFSNETKVSDANPFTFTVTQDSLLQAVALNTVYSVTLNLQQGSLSAGNVTSYVFGTGATLPSQISRTGCTFLGWTQTDQLADSTYVTAISTTDFGNKTYYAKWQLNHTWETLALGNIAKEYDGDSCKVQLITSPTEPTAGGMRLVYAWEKDGQTFANESDSFAIHLWEVAQNGNYSVSLYWTNDTLISKTQRIAFNVTFTPKQLTLVALSVKNKTYDRTDTASIKSWGTLAGILKNDQVSVVQQGVWVKFNSANVGDHIVVFSTLSLTGTDNTNYILAQPSNLKAVIQAKNLTDSDIHVAPIPVLYYESGSEQPAIVICHGDTPLKITSEYTFSCQFNYSAKTGVVTISGVSNYCGTANVSFNLFAIAGLPSLPGVSLVNSIPEIVHVPEHAVRTFYQLPKSTVDNCPVLYLSSNPLVAEIVNDNILIIHGTGSAEITCLPLSNDDYSIISSFQLSVGEAFVGNEWMEKTNSLHVWQMPTRNSLMYVEAGFDESKLNGAVYELYNSSGQLVNCCKAEGYRTGIRAGNATGMHILILKGKNGFQQSIKLMVKP